MSQCSASARLFMSLFGSITLQFKTFMLHPVDSVCLSKSILPRGRRMRRSSVLDCQVRFSTVPVASLCSLVASLNCKFREITFSFKAWPASTLQLPMRGFYDGPGRTSGLLLCLFQLVRHQPYVFFGFTYALP